MHFPPYGERGLGNMAVEHQEDTGRWGLPTTMATGSEGLALPAKKKTVQHHVHKYLDSF